jgi:hypothetical protein
MTPEVNIKISQLRQKITSGDYTQDDMREAIELMRKARGQAGAAAAAKPKSAKAANIDSGALLDDLDKL